MSAPRIHPDTIEAVQQGLNIVEVISDYVVLKKKGKDYLGLCPFHNEKTPSFSVSGDKQVYYCFGCGAGGNSFKFLMELNKQSFTEVVLDLARRYQVPVQTVEPEERQEIERQLTLREQLYEVLAVASNFFQHALRQLPGELALKYLRQERKLSDTTIKQFELGYAPAGWETLYRYLVEQKRYPVSLLEAAGLVKPRREGKGYYDTFRDRVTIPIKDVQGRVIAFGSRSLRTEQQPKYLNSPETPVFDKSKTLYGLDRARKAISQADRAIVVEGYFDAIALHKAGVNNVVASLGTAFTDTQLKKLLRYTSSKQVILNFDADKAGVKATERAITDVKNLVYSGQVKLRVLSLPDGKDADELLGSHEDGLKTYLAAVEQAPLWLDWQIDNLVAGKDLKAADQAPTVAKGMVNLLNRLLDSNQRNYYLNRCAEILSHADSRLVSSNLANLKSQLKPEFRSRNNFNYQKKQIKATATTKLNLVTNPEEQLLREAESLLLLIYIHCPKQRNQIVDKLEAKDLCFSISEYRFLWQEIITIEQQNNTQESVLENYILKQLYNRSLDFPPQMKKLNKLLNLTEKTQEDVFRAQTRIENAIASLEQVSCIKYELHCTQQLENIDPLTESDKIQHLYEEIRYSKQRIQELEKIRLSLDTSY